MTAHRIDEARAIARNIIQRIVQDDQFANRLRQDPRSTLRASGIPDWAMNDFIINDLGLEADVEGYSMDRCAVTSLLWIDGDGVDPQ